jgi:hypothetical protein
VRQVGRDHRYIGGVAAQEACLAGPALAGPDYGDLLVGDFIAIAELGNSG